MASASPRKSKTAETAPVTATVQIPNISLADVIAATNAGDVVYTAPEFHNPLIESGQVEINPAMVDAQGNIATRAIIKENKMTDTAIESTKPTFEIEDDVVIPEKCPMTEMIIIKSTGYGNLSNPYIFLIDTQKGYVKSNIIITCVLANQLRNCGKEQILAYAKYLNSLP